MMSTSMYRLQIKTISIDFNFEKHPQNNQKCGWILKKDIDVFSSFGEIRAFSVPKNGEVRAKWQAEYRVLP